MKLLVNVKLNVDHVYLMKCTTITEGGPQLHLTPRPVSPCTMNHNYTRDTDE